MAKHGVARGLLLTTFVASAPLSAQSTDGYQAYQVFPVVVDTASFSQRFNIESFTTSTVRLTYYPAQGTSQVGPLDCGTQSFPGQTTFASLRALCPALPAGSQFGLLVVRPESSGIPRFAGFSRVSNPQGNGFSVESFPLSAFSSADAVVTGLRRRAAAGPSPSFQTNCFVGNLPELGAATGTTTTVRISLSNFDGSAIGSTDVALQAGQVVRLLDVFAATGAAAGDHLDAVARFAAISPSPAKAGIVGFCTVQDNTSFGADFRIAKPEPASIALGARDHTSLHITYETDSVPIPSGAGTTEIRNFNITPGDNGNVHVFYFRHPDWIGCSLHDPVTGVALDNSAGLEMRLSRNGTTIAGGNNVVGFSGVFLRDKHELAYLEVPRYTLEIESNGNNSAATRAYALRCTSGNGHTRGEISQWHVSGVKF